MKISAEKFQAIISLSADKRYEHFIKVAADQNSVWGLYDSGWALMGTDEGDEVFPVWPAEAYAGAFATDDWVSYQPREIQMDSFLDELIPSLQESGTLLGVFPTTGDRGITPTLEQVEADIREELSRIE